ncbi:hypothetical protein AVEN_131152-1 [Araneus ventricosus]|uniref:Uncharacterized protein n=1 Tax=Araneus ventricosus TaxID=182803 RepID=A0A4Y2RZ00_ARAVE|nr:hypothetical protein AVEN_131152-1 [Araneus ventricosus]
MAIFTQQSTCATSMFGKVKRSLIDHQYIVVTSERPLLFGKKHSQVAVPPQQSLLERPFVRKGNTSLSDHPYSVVTYLNDPLIVEREHFNKWPSLLQ